MKNRRCLVLAGLIPAVVAAGLSANLSLRAEAAPAARAKRKPVPAAAVKKTPAAGKPQVPLSGEAKEEWEKGEAAFKAGDFTTAATHFKGVVKLSPDNSRAHERLGSVLAATENYAAGESEERTAAGLDPKDYLPHLILGRILLVLKGEKEGVDEAQKAYDINPFACAAFLNFANKDRFDPHRWFVQANYWKEMAAARRAEEKATEAANSESAKTEAGKTEASKTETSESHGPAASSGSAGEQSQSADSGKSSAEQERSRTEEKGSCPR